MEKTFAREIYKRMEIGKAYKLSDLMKIVDTEVRLPHFPEIKTWEDLNGFDFKPNFILALRNMETSGYVRTESREFITCFVRGVRRGTPIEQIHTEKYTAKVFIRIK